MPSVRTFLSTSLALHVLVAAAIVHGGRSRPASASADAPRPDPTAFFTGDTFEVPALLPTGAVTGSAAAVTPDESASDEDAIPERPAKRSGARGHTPRPAQASESASGQGGSGEGTLFGGVGERSSVDLATAFTRGFPQAASADPVWARVPYGSAGEATVVLEIDAAGALVSSRIDGNPSPALRAGLERTLAFIHARTFTAQRAVTRLHIRSEVSPDEVHDGLHGEVFAIGGSFRTTEGSAFFALAIGRRVDLHVTE